MLTIKKIFYACTGMVLCALVMAGCSENQEKKQGQKSETKQEQIGREAAGNQLKPLEESQKTADKVEARASQNLEQMGNDAQQTGQATKDGQPQTGGKEKRKLEGC